MSELPEIQWVRTHHQCEKAFLDKPCDCPPPRRLVDLDDIIDILNDAGIFRDEHPADYLTRRFKDVEVPQA